MFNPTTFFNAVRDTILGPDLDQGEVDGCNYILAEFKAEPLAFTAYALGTAYHETRHTMQPVREAFWLSDAQANRYFFRMYDITGQRPKVARELGNTQPGDGVRFAGRGYPQTTGRRNYTKASQVLGVDLIEHPEEMMKPYVAAAVMRHAMVNGWYTGKKLGDFLPRHGAAAFEQMRSARRVVNGMDRAGDIAQAAMSFQSALIKAGYPHEHR